MQRVINGEPLLLWRALTAIHPCPHMHAADTSRGALKIHEYSCYALAGATPIALLAPKGSLILNISDTVLAFAIPVHMHIAMNGVLTDYLPKVAKGE